MKRICLENGIILDCIKSENGGFTLSERYKQQYRREKEAFVNTHNLHVQNCYNQIRENERHLVLYMEHYDVVGEEQRLMWRDMSAAWEALPPLIVYNPFDDKIEMDPIMGDILADF